MVQVSAKSKTTGGVQVEAANCLATLLEGDTTLQAVLVEDHAVLKLTCATEHHRTRRSHPQCSHGSVHHHSRGGVVMCVCRCAMLNDKSTEEAATRLLGVFDECFDDLVAAAKK